MYGRQVYLFELIVSQHNYTLQPGTINEKMKEKKPYSQRTDIEKIESNWRKTNGLLNRKEFSNSIIRAVTAVELAANFVVRKELQEAKNLDEDFVNHLWKWSNGIYGKFDKLLIPIFKGTDTQSVLKKLKNKVKVINKERNAIAHSGQFKNENTANKVVKESKKVIETLVRIHDKDFQLPFGKE